ncbi:MAG: oxidoreductase, partial [Pyrinomonadaceae bacterium]|nr:oxidoreductase [Pyrinomonadaceae bacterium]
QDPREGGGRIVGEVCHFIDLMQFLTGAPVRRVYAEAVASRDHETPDEDSVLVTLRFADGSNGAVAYLAQGDRALPKECVEIYAEGRTFVIDDFRGATSYAGGRGRTKRLRGQDKGQREQTRAACAVVLGGLAAPIPLEDLEATTRATFRILESLRTGQAVEVR